MGNKRKDTGKKERRKVSEEEIQWIDKRENGNFTANN
jgi:hypothetical protein